MSDQKTLTQDMANHLLESVEREREMSDVLHGAVLNIAILEEINQKLVAALRRLVAANDAYASVFAAGSDEAALMLEYGEAMDAARAALADAGVEL